MWALAGGVIVLLLAAAVVSIPLIFRDLENYDHWVETANPVYSEADALLDAIGELELSYRSGKLSESDYSAERRLLQRNYIDLTEPAAGASDEASNA